MCSCGSVVEHWVSGAKSCGFNSQGTHILEKMYSLSKSLWIKASANVNVKSQSMCRRRDLRFRRWAAHDLRVRAEVRYKQLNVMRQFSNIWQTFTIKKQKVKCQTFIFRDANCFWPFQICLLLIYKYFILNCNIIFHTQYCLLYFSSK